MGELFPFIVGSARSGTTLIREMLDTHPRLAVPPESHFLVPIARERARYESDGGVDVDALSADLRAHERFRRFRLKPEQLREALDPAPATLADAIRRIYAAYAAKKGKERYADKTPHYVMHVKLLAGLLPESKWVHVLRDGRNAALSIMEWPLGPNKLDEALLMWRRRVEAGLQAAEMLGPERYLQYRHEDLVDESEKVLRQICEFIELRFDDRMLRYYEENPVGAEFIKKFPHQRALALPPTKGLRDFRQQMTPDQIEMTERLIGDLLEQLGYGRVTDAPMIDPERLAAMQEAAVESRRTGKDQRIAERRAVLEEEKAASGDGGLLRRAKRFLGSR